MKRTTIMIATTLLATHIIANTEVVDGITWNYAVSEGEATLVYPAVPSGTEGSVAVPSYLGGYPVTVIGEKAFCNCYGLTGVTLPSSIKSIAGAAFNGCFRITSMTLPSSMETIWDGAFKYCRWLKDVYFKGDVVPNVIGADAFNGCQGDLIMHVPMTWQGRGRTLCGYTVWRGEETNDVITLTTTNVVIHYLTTNVPVNVVAPISRDTAIVNVMTEIEGGNIAIPDTWAKNYPDFEKRFGSDFSAALTKYTGKYDGAGNPLFVWQDYVAGTDPTDVYDVFTATITMVEGKPQVQWDPVLVETEAAKRVYTKYGKVKLTDEWEAIPEGEEGNYNFFKVTVKMK